MAKLSLVYQAICDGAFGNIVNGQNQQGMPVRQIQVTPAILSKILGDENGASLDSDTIDATIKLYTQSKNDQIAANIQKLQDQITALQALSDKLKTPAVVVP